MPLFLRFFLFLFLCCASLPLYAQLDNPSAAVLRKREARWFRQQGIEPLAYNWHHPQTRQLRRTMVARRWWSNVLLGLGVGLTASGMVTFLSVPSLPPANAQPTPLSIKVGTTFGHLPPQNKLLGMLQLGASIPLYASASAANRALEKRLQYLRNCQECRFHFAPSSKGKP